MFSILVPRLLRARLHAVPHAPTACAWLVLSSAPLVRSPPYIYPSYRPQGAPCFASFPFPRTRLARRPTFPFCPPAPVRPLLSARLCLYLMDIPTRTPRPRDPPLLRHCLTAPPPSDSPSVPRHCCPSPPASPPAEPAAAVHPLAPGSWLSALAAGLSPPCPTPLSARSRSSDSTQCLILSTMLALRR